MCVVKLELARSEQLSPEAHAAGAIDSLVCPDVTQQGTPVGDRVVAGVNVVSGRAEYSAAPDAITRLHAFEESGVALTARRALLEHLESPTAVKDGGLSTCIGLGHTNEADALGAQWGVEQLVVWWDRRRRRKVSREYGIRSIDGGAHVSAARPRIINRLGNAQRAT